MTRDWIEYWLTVCAGTSTSHAIVHCWVALDCLYSLVSIYLQLHMCFVEFGWELDRIGMECGCWTVDWLWCDDHSNLIKGTKRIQHTTKSSCRWRRRRFSYIHCNKRKAGRDYWLNLVQKPASISYSTWPNAFRWAPPTRTASYEQAPTSN